MKIIRVTFMMLALLLLSCVVMADEPKLKPAHYEVTYIITYNSISLEQAAELEKRVILEHQKSCGIDVKIKKLNTRAITANEGLYWTNESITVK